MCLFQSGLDSRIKVLECHLPASTMTTDPSAMQEQCSWRPKYRPFNWLNPKIYFLVFFTPFFKKRIHVFYFNWRYVSHSNYEKLIFSSHFLPSFFYKMQLCWNNSMEAFSFSVFSSYFWQLTMPGPSNTSSGGGHLCPNKHWGRTAGAAAGARQPKKRPRSFSHT